MDSVKERLARYRQIKLSVIGRKSGKTVSMPVWFVLEEDKLYLLPVRGSDTEWWNNVAASRITQSKMGFAKKSSSLKTGFYFPIPALVLFPHLG